MKYEIIVGGEPEYCPNAGLKRLEDQVLVIESERPVEVGPASNYRKEIGDKFFFYNCYSWMTGCDCSHIIEKCHFGDIINVKEIKD